jgi:hypothetical protein
VNLITFTTLKLGIGGSSLSGESTNLVSLFLTFHLREKKDVSINLFNDSIIKIIIPEANKFIIEFGQRGN